MSFLFILYICSCSLFAAAAPETNKRRTVKVGVLNDPVFATIDKNGDWTGFDIECLIAISQKAGFNLEFVDSSQDPDFLGNLDAGIYDIVADIVMTPERIRKYSFTDTPIGNTNNTLSVSMDDDRWEYGNIEQISKMKIGVLTTYANNRDFRVWCGNHSVSPVITEYQNTKQMTAALLGHEIDGGVYSTINNAEYAAKIRTIMKFIPETFYYAFRKNDVNLKNKVDDAISQILVGNVNYLSDLRNRYEKQYEVNSLPFSAEEKQFIALHPVLTVAVLNDDEPFYYKSSNGSDRGIIPDYYTLAAKNTTLKFTYKKYPSQEEAVKAVKNGEADIVGLFSNGIILSQKYGLALTDSFYAVDNILLKKSGTKLDRIKTIAVVKRNSASLSDNVKKEFPNAICKTYETAKSCFEALKEGNADAVVIGHPSATWLMNQTNANAYNIIPIPYAADEFCGAVNSLDIVLCSILSKRFESSKGSFTGIVIKNTLPQSDWKTVISRIPPAWIIVIICILTSFVIGLTWTLVLLRKRQRERSAILMAQAETEKREIQMEAIQKNTEQQGRFFANVSHDMRTPLNAVLGFIRLAKQDSVPPEKKTEYLDKAESSGILMLDLINDTLTMSKASSGKLELHPAAVNSDSIGRTIITPIQTLAAEKHIAFSLDKSGYHSRTILADQLALQKIFLNILNNSVKYTPENGHIQVTVYDERKDNVISDTVFVIRDDGIGISSEFLPHVFEPFMQEKRPGYDSVGTGLGLSIVKQLVDLMGGKIEVQSKKDNGTTFTVRLHLAETKEKPVSHADSRENTARLSGKKVLLCEDNILNREIAVALLKDKGIVTVEAENGKAGVDKFTQSAENEFDVILMDLRMPVMGGIEAMQAIRALNRPDAKTIPVIAMTADAFESDVQQCLNAGMSAHVSKPIEPALLYQAIQKAIFK